MKYIIMPVLRLLLLLYYIILGILTCILRIIWNPITLWKDFKDGLWLAKSQKDIRSKICTLVFNLIPE